jgi:hypothetical protein
LITDFEQAEAIVATGDADMIALARGFYTISGGLGMQPHPGAHVNAPKQYLRSQPQRIADQP